MSTLHAHLTPVRVARRRRAARPPDLLAPPAEDRTASAIDAEQAEELIADLVALVDAGLLTPIVDPASTTRYAVNDAPFTPA